MNALWDRGTVALRSGLLRVSAVLPRDLFRCGHRRWRPEMQSGQSRPRESGMSGSLGKINVVLVHEARADGPCHPNLPRNLVTLRRVMTVLRG
jgi:hypothetical protein